MQADRRLVGVGFLTAFGLGAMQILALLPGISRDGIVMVSGMFRGLSRQDAARFSFLLSAPVILAAGVLKIPDLTGPLGAGIRGQVLFGSALSFVGAYLALRFLVRYFSNPARTLTPFAIYCLAAGLAASSPVRAVTGSWAYDRRAAKPSTSGSRGGRDGGARVGMPGTEGAVDAAGVAPRPEPRAG